MKANSAKKTRKAPRSLVEKLRFILDNGTQNQHRAVEWFITRVYRRVPAPPRSLSHVVRGR